MWYGGTPPWKFENQSRRKIAIDHKLDRAWDRSRVRVFTSPRILSVHVFLSTSNVYWHILTSIDVRDVVQRNGKSYSHRHCRLCCVLLYLISVASKHGSKGPRPEASGFHKNYIIFIKYHNFILLFFFFFFWKFRNQVYK
jgi:hypothetical protein